MALEAHVLLDGTDDTKVYNAIRPALEELNAASFAGIGGVMVVAVGRTKEQAHERVVSYTEGDLYVEDDPPA